jgi:uncharacterized protein YbjT (DUF2867 family)
MVQPNSIVAVTGATGFVGRYVCRELARRGFRVRALVRDPRKAKEVLAGVANLEVSAGDVCEPASLDRLLAGASACIHLVGIIREVRAEPGKEPQTFERMHVVATRRVLEACARNGVKRYAHMSALGVKPDGKAAYQRTKFEAERLVRASGDPSTGEGLAWTIFRPSIIHGPDGEFVRLMADLGSSEIPPYVFMPYFAKTVVDFRVPLGSISFEPAKVQPVAVEDVAFCFAECLVRDGTIGEVYNLTGPDVLDWRELTEFMRDALPGTNKNMGTWYVPGTHASLLAQAAGAIGLGPLLPFDAGQAVMATEDNVSDTHKVRADFGIEPRAFRSTVEAYADRV